MRRIALMTLVLGVVLTAVHALAGVPGTTSTTEKQIATAPRLIVVPAQPTNIDPWLLLQSDGDELFAQMCASCHGEAGAGRGKAARSLATYPPPLTNLRDVGIPRKHWVYVIESPCDDSHHWGQSHTATMPCWQRVFRETLGNDAAPLLVSSKLASYLDTIQE